MIHWIKIFITLLIGVLFTSCTKTSGKTYRPIFYLKKEQPLVIYIDSAFTSAEKESIRQAMLTWQKTGNGKIWFVPIWSVPKPGRLRNMEKPGKNQHIFFWRLNRKDNYHISESLKEKLKDKNGYFIPGPGHDSAHLLIFPDSFDPKDFYKVALHELGHLLGIQHIEQPGVMNEFAASSCITKYDAQVLCDIYLCEPVSEC